MQSSTGSLVVKKKPPRAATGRGIPQNQVLMAEIDRKLHVAAFWRLAYMERVWTWTRGAKEMPIRLLLHHPDIGEFTGFGDTQDY